MPKGYWINHVEEIIDQDAFGKYITKWNALIDRGEAKMIAIGPVAKTQIGAVNMQFAAVVEFETFDLNNLYVVGLNHRFKQAGSDLFLICVLVSKNRTALDIVYDCIDCFKIKISCSKYSNNKASK